MADATRTRDRRRPVPTGTILQNDDGSRHTTNSMALAPRVELFDAEKFGEAVPIWEIESYRIVVPFCFRCDMALAGKKRPRHNYLCSKSTGAVTSCTLKYFANAGYFLATASYIAYATFR